VKVFFDTSGFVALENRRDESHQVALRAYRGMIKAGDLFTTSDYVFDETVTLLKRRAGHRVAVGWGRRLLASAMFEIAIVDRDVLEAGLDVFEGAGAQAFSFTDCTSFALMRAREIDTAFALDEDFTRVGFRRVPRAR
jgi:hypothetical protein